MNEKIRDLYNQLYQDESYKDLKKFIWFIEKNIEIIEASDSVEKEEYVNVTKILADYGSALYNAGYFTKAVPYLDKAISRIENYSEFKNKDLLEEPLYETSIFNRGLTNYNLKKYKTAISDFKKLSDKFPENDRYKNWYNGSVDHSLRTLEWIFFAAIFICIIALYSLKHKDGIFYYISFGSLLTSLILSISLTVYKKRLKIK